MNTKADSYAAQLRAALHSKGMSIRDLETRLAEGPSSFSYEHIRKVCSGLPVMSEHFNTAVCQVLGLDAAMMWQLALRGKATSGGRTAAIASTLAHSAPSAELRGVWAELTTEDHVKVKKYMESLAEQRRVERVEISRDPKAIRDQISRLAGLLAACEPVASREDSKPRGKPRAVSTR